MNEIICKVKKPSGSKELPMNANECTFVKVA